MKIDLHKITVRELTNGYVDNAEYGVKAFGGRLDVRPPISANLFIKRSSAMP